MAVMRFYALLGLLYLAGASLAINFDAARVRRYLNCPSDHINPSISEEFRSILQCPNVLTLSRAIAADVEKAFRIINPNNDDKLTRQEADKVMAKFGLDRGENKLKFEACDRDSNSDLTLEEYTLCSVVSYSALIVRADIDDDNSLSKTEMTNLIGGFASIVYRTFDEQRLDRKINELGEKTQYTLADVVKVDTSLFDEFVKEMRNRHGA